MAELSTWDASSTAGGSKEVGEELPVGAVVGRYVLLGRLGRGGMGVVYDAYDPELGRRIALKILHVEASSSEARTRLLREAQSLARLTHPNVVTIYDAGALDGRVWLAMERVEGETLAAWLAAARRGWREIVAVMRDAGRGLQAAHAAGLVHRDFKPENVMIARDGRALVMDFGLAKPERTGEFTAPASEAAAGRSPVELASRSSPSFDALATPLTRADSIVGTPAYMPPEQLLGLPVDVRADVFAFSVTLWEALCGERPFAGETLQELAMNVVQNRVQEPPPGRRVPGWLREIVVRGLHADAARRFASMAEMLAALDGRERQRRRGVVVGVVAAALAIAAAMGVGVHVEARRRDAACVELGAAVDAIWDEAAHERVRGAIVGAGKGHGEATAARVLPALDAWAAGWRSTRTERCREATAGGREAAALEVSSDECLDERLGRFGAVVEALGRADAAAARWAVNAALRLPASGPCVDPAYLSERPSIPGGGAPEVTAIRATAAEASALEVTGHYMEGLAVARRGLIEAEALGWAPLVAELRLQVAKLSEKAGELAAGEEAAAAAYVEAGQVGAREVAADAAALLVRLGTRLARHGEAQVWSRAARVALAALGEQGGLRRAALLTYEAGLYAALGDYAAARERHGEALAIRERVLGSDHPEVGVSLNNLANVEQALGHFAAARELLSRSHALEVRANGPDHPEVATTLNNLGLVLYELGEVAEARRLYEEALAIQERSLGADHASVAVTLNNLATSVWATDAAAARELYERAVAIEEKTYGADHPEVAASLANLATLCVELEDYGCARPLYERARGILEAKLGAEHPDLAVILIGIADIAEAEGDHAGAIAGYERALGIVERSLGAEHPNVGAVLVRLAESRLGGGDEAGAIAASERALALAEAGEGSSHARAVASFALARSLWGRAGERGRARELAGAARAIFVSAEEATYVEEIDAWVAEVAPAR